MLMPTLRSSLRCCSSMGPRLSLKAAGRWQCSRPALLLGNATALVPRLIPGANAQAFETGENTRVVQDQMSFFIKSFFFVLIGLMFPTSPRLILLGAVPVLLPLAARIPAVWLATLGLRLSRKQSWMLIIAVPR